MELHAFDQGYRGGDSVDDAGLDGLVDVGPVEHAHVGAQPVPDLHRQIVVVHPELGALEVLEALDRVLYRQHAIGPAQNGTDVADGRDPRFHARLVPPALGEVRLLEAQPMVAVVEHERGAAPAHGGLPLGEIVGVLGVDVDGAGAHLLEHRLGSAELLGREDLDREVAFRVLADEVGELLEDDAFRTVGRHLGRHLPGFGLGDDAEREEETGCHQGHQTGEEMRFAHHVFLLKGRRAGLRFLSDCRFASYS